MASCVIELDAEIVGAGQDILTHRRVGTDVVEHGKSTATVSTPKSFAQRLDSLLVAEIVELHSLGLAHEVVANALLGFAEPVPEVVLEMEPKVLDLGGDLFTYVETVGDLAAEDRDDPAVLVEVDLMLARQLGPVDVISVVTIVRNDQRPNSTSLGDDVFSR